MQCPNSSWCRRCFPPHLQHFSITGVPSGQELPWLLLLTKPEQGSCSPASLSALCWASVRCWLRRVAAGAAQ